MRIALVIAMSALVAGCSSTTGGTAVQARQTPDTPAGSSAPKPGAAIGDVIRWIEAGTPADAAAYHSMTRDGVVTALDDGVAFTTARTEANCVTDEYRDAALACLVKLADPPPRPPGIEAACPGVR